MEENSCVSYRDLNKNHDCNQKNGCNNEKTSHRHPKENHAIAFAKLILSHYLYSGCCTRTIHNDVQRTELNRAIRANAELWTLQLIKETKTPSVFGLPLNALTQASGREHLTTSSSSINTKFSSVLHLRAWSSCGMPTAML